MQFPFLQAYFGLNKRLGTKGLREHATPRIEEGGFTQAERDERDGTPD